MTPSRRSRRLPAPASRRERSATRFAFSHDVVHEVVLQGIDPTRRAELHRRAAAVLASGCDADPSFHAVVADHLDQAGPDHADAASVRVGARGAPGAGRARLPRRRPRSSGVALLPRLPTSSARATLILEEGDSLLLAGDLVGARERFTACADLARRIGAPEVRARAVLGIGAGPGGLGGTDRERRAGRARGGRARGAARRCDRAAIDAARAPVGHRRHARDDGDRAAAGRGPRSSWPSRSATRS